MPEGHLRVRRHYLVSVLGRHSGQNYHHVGLWHFGRTSTSWRLRQMCIEPCQSDDYHRWTNIIWHYWNPLRARRGRLEASAKRLQMSLYYRYWCPRSRLPLRKMSQDQTNKVTLQRLQWARFKRRVHQFYHLPDL